MNIFEASKFIYVTMLLLVLTVAGLSYGLYQTKSDLNEIKQNQVTSSLSIPGKQSTGLSNRDDFFSQSIEDRFAFMQKNMEEMVSTFFKDDPFFFQNGFGLSAHSPKVNINEDSDKFEVIVDIPEGQDVEFNAEVRDGTLVISGQSESAEENNSDNQFSYSSNFNRFSQSVMIPENADAGKMEVDKKEGQFIVTIPKIG